MTADATEPAAAPARRLVLAELLDRALTKGVVLRTDAVISVAGIDLLFVDIKALVASVDTAARIGAGPAAKDHHAVSLRDL